MALLWNHNSRTSGKKDTLEKKTDMTNFHNMIAYQRKKISGPFSNRDFLARVIWKPHGDDGFLLVAKPTKCATRPLVANTLRGKVVSVMKITSVGNMETKIDLVLQPDFGKRWGCTCVSTFYPYSPHLPPRR